MTRIVARRGASAGGRGADRLQGHGAVGAGEDRAGRDGRLRARLAERAGPIVEMGDPEYTVLVKVPKARLPSRAP